MTAYNKTKQWIEKQITNCLGVPRSKLCYKGLHVEKYLFMHVSNTLPSQSIISDHAVIKLSITTHKSDN